MLRIAQISVLAAAIALAAPAVAAPVAASPKAAGRARILKPLALTAIRDLSFPTIIMNNVTMANVVMVSVPGGYMCGTPGELTCSGPIIPARYNVQGTKGIQVKITAATSNLVNTTSGGSETLVLTPVLVSSTLTLASSGSPGTNFDVGGWFTIRPTTVDGLYVGDLDITVDYL
jgi:hypothetical protein